MGTDAETGEWNQEVQARQFFDQETGEVFDYRLLANPPSPPSRKTRGSRKSTCCAYLKEHEEVQRQRQVTLGYNPTHKLFLIPSLFFFFRITAVLLLFCELVLHIWAHRMNQINADPAVFYRSPLHLITSQFCARCTSETRMIKLGKIQDKRREAKRLLAFSA